MKLHSPQNLPQRSRGIWAHGNHGFCSPKSPFFAFLLPFLRSYSLPTSKCTSPWFFGFPLMHFSALVGYVGQISWGNSCLDSCLICWNYGVVWDGHRPMVDSEIIGHVTLPPFPFRSCLNMRPPSARWNASMAFAHKFVNFCLWNWYVHIWSSFLSVWTTCRS